MNISRIFKRQQSVQLSMLVMLERMLADAQQGVCDADLYPVPEPSDEVKLLIETGFTNARVVKEYEDRKTVISKLNQEIKNTNHSNFERVNNAVAALKMLAKAREIYGNDVILISFEKFKELCDKYELVCGSFDRYTGPVPVDKLEEIQRILNIESSELPIYKLIYVKEFVTESRWGESHNQRAKARLQEFPFVSDYGWGFGGHSTITFHDGEKVRLDDAHITPGKKASFFIAAPKKMMSPGTKFRYEEKDPFICAYLPQGVLILTRWGEEAKDSLIRRYEQFNQNLNNFISSNAH